MRNLRDVNIKVEEHEIRDTIDVKKDGDFTFAIVITTFELRFFEYALPLIKKIRKVTKIPIVCVMNGNYNQTNSYKLRKCFINEIMKFEEIYLVTHPNFVSMTYSWNLGIQLTQNKKI